MGAKIGFKLCKTPTALVKKMYKYDFTKIQKIVYNKFNSLGG